MNYRRNCDKTHCIAAHFAYSLNSRRLAGARSVAADNGVWERGGRPAGHPYATTRPLQGAPIASSPALAADSWRRGGSPGPELRADGRQRPVARRRGVGPGRGRRHVAPGPARPGVVQGRLDPYRQPQPCSARARQRRGPPPRPGDHAQARRRAAGRRAALPARPCLRRRPVVQPQPEEGQRQHLLHDPGDSRHRVRDPRRAGRAACSPCSRARCWRATTRARCRYRAASRWWPAPASRRSRLLVARPRDAVQWSLFYPPIFSAPPGDAPEPRDGAAAGGRQ